jgi:solute carrier family 41
VWYVHLIVGYDIFLTLKLGLAGNLGSIYASRISTCLHRGVQEQFKIVENTLLLMNVPVQILFLVIVWFLDIGHLDFTWAFSISYFVVSMICVSETFKAL